MPLRLPPPLSITEVWRVAELLMHKNGKTTTLEVKHYLCSEGFRALQCSVSEYVDKLAHSEN